MGRMAALAERLRTTRPRYPKCSVGKFEDSLSDEDREEFRQIMADPGITAVAISAAVKEEYGATISPQSTSRHRRGGCSCP